MRHGVVVMVMKDELVRVDAALGALQGPALKGMLALGARAVDKHGVPEAGPSVSGVTQAALDKTASGVDRAIGEHMRRLVNPIEDGQPRATVGANIPRRRASPESEHFAARQQAHRKIPRRGRARRTLSRGPRRQA